MYAIQRIEDGKFVSVAYHSYTDKLQDARIWESVALALHHKCGNERIVNVVDLLRCNIAQNNNK